MAGLPWDRLFRDVVAKLWDSVPELAVLFVAIAGAAALIHALPLTRSLLRYLTSHNRTAEVNEAVLVELTELRANLGEVIERLDATERRLASERSPKFPAELADPDRTPQPT